MTKTLQKLGLVLAFGVALTPLARTQEQPAAAAPKGAAVVMPLKIQVMISRYQGDKKVSSLPYSLSVTGGGGRLDPTAGPAFVGRANLRMGAKVPIAVTTFAPAAPDASKALQSWQYQDVGTNIDCQVWAVDEGRFRVEITIDDSSVYPDEKESPGVIKGIPALRSFRASDAMLLKDGGTAQFTAATDKVSGETVRVDVTLTVVK